MSDYIEYYMHPMTGEIYTRRDWYLIYLNMDEEIWFDRDSSSINEYDHSDWWEQGGMIGMEIDSKGEWVEI